jgi:ribosome-associated protein
MLKESIIEGLKNGKGKSITCIDLRKISGAVADFFIICHGESSTQVEGLKKAVYENCFVKCGEKPWHEEGVSNAEWILIDYVNIVVHIFHRDTRNFYNLEELWADASIEEFENV